VHTSPLVRCVQTAAGVARALGGLPLVAHAALSACAQKVADAGAAGSAVNYAPPAELRAAASGLEVEFADDDEETVRKEGEGVGLHGFDRFRAAVERIAREAEGDGAVLVVTHREGLRGLDRLCGEGRMATPYCTAHEYDFDLATGKWALVHESAIRVPRCAEGWRALLLDYRFAFVDETRRPMSHHRCALM
jgi:broad specificity phosphatase PhoE